MSEMLTVIAHARAKPGKEAQAREILQALVVPTRLEEGCIDYDLHQSAEDPSSFVFYENWTSPEALEAHAKSPHITHFRSICAESLLEPPCYRNGNSCPESADGIRGSGVTNLHMTHRNNCQSGTSVQRAIARGAESRNNWS